MSAAPVRLDGGGDCNVHVLSPDKTKLAALSDTQGAYLTTTAVLGNHWSIENRGIGVSALRRQFAAGAWSVAEGSNSVLYGGTGESQAAGTAGNSGGFNVGTLQADGHFKWVLRSSVPQWAGNHVKAPLPTDGWKRSTGRLLMMDSLFTFAGTYQQGILRSSNTGGPGGVPGSDDFPVAVQMAGAAPGVGNWFCRCMAYDLTNFPAGTQFYAGFYDSAGAPAGLWKCTNAHAATPNMTAVSMTGGPNAVEDICQIGDYLYVAGANQGIYRYGPLSGAAAWVSVNGAGIPTGTTAQNWWLSVAGFVDGSGNHVLMAADSNPTAGALAQTLVLLTGTAPLTVGSITYTNQAGAVQITNVPTATGSYPWWLPAAGLHVYLGGGGFITPFLTVDATNPAAPNWYCAGSGGCYRKIGAAGWTVANSGMPMFLGHSLAVSPVRQQSVFCSSDWDVFDDLAVPGLEDATTLTNVPPAPSQEGFAAAISADGSLVYGSSGAKYTNASGKVYSRPWNSQTWTSLGIETSGLAAGKVAVGLCALNDAGGNKILLAAVWNGGLFRYAPDPTSGVYGWTQRAATIGTSGVTALSMPVYTDGAGNCYCFDRQKGVWRSADYGKTWVLLWAKTTGDAQSGSVAADPTVPGLIWVSAAGNLYKITGADAGTVAGGGATLTGPVGGLPGSTSAGPVACDHAGHLYLATQDTGNGSGVYRSTDGAVTWADVVGDGTFAIANCNPEHMVISPVDGRVYVSGSNVVTTLIPGGGGGQPASAPFTERQQSANISSPGGGNTLTLWFSETSGGPGPGGLGAPSLAGSMLSARLELTDGSATITPPADPGWALRVDKAAQATTGTARVQIWDYLGNPGGLGGPVSAPTFLPAGLRRPAPPGVPAHGRGIITAGGPLGRHAPPSPGGPPVVLAGQQSTPGSSTAQPAPGSIVFTSSSNAAMKGKLFEYTTPPGTVQVFDQSGSAGAQAAATTMPVTAGGANTMTGGLGIAAWAANLSVIGSGGSWSPTPAGWTADGSVNNATLLFDTLFNNALTGGPTSVTATNAAGAGATMIAWAGAVATYYALATSAPAITTTSPLPGGTSGVPYSAALAAAGGATPYTWAVTSGTVPPGTTLSSAGVLSGTPTGGGGTYSFITGLTDAAGQAATASFTVTIAAPLTVTTASLPGTATGVIYSQALAAAGGTAPYSWAVTAGALPPGISLTSPGVVTGTAALAGTFAFTVSVLDQHGLTATQALSITVTAGALTVATQVLSFATLGASYSAALAASGGTPPYTWSLTAGNLPAGLTLGADGSIAGVPTSQGASTFTVGVTDNVGAHAFASFTITVFLLIPVIPPPGPWRVLYGPPQPAGGISGVIAQAQSKVVTLRTEPDQQDQVDINIDGTSAAALGITELLTDIVVLFGDKPVFCGRIGPGQDDLDAGAHRLAITAMDYRSILGRRKLIASDTLSYTNTEQALIAWNLLQATQNRPGGQLGIVRGVGQVTGVTRTYTATAGDMVGDDITALAQLNGGFEWGINSKNAQFTDLRLDIFSPWQGTDNGVVLMYGDGRVSNISRSVDPSAYANSVMVTGNSAKTLTTQNLDAADIATNPAGRFDTVIGTSDNTQSTLNDDAAAQLAQVQVLIPTYTVVLYPGAWAAAGGPSWLWKGDQVTVVIDSGRLAVIDKLRVVEMSFDIGNDNVETLTLTIGRIPFRVDQKIKNILKRLRYLETR